ncbi:bro [Peridroma alphabaculovirus]|uniref:Bro n=1 Tax=Peridroma alphabaculovirus TaxID=1346829 RepID=A0A068LMW1_9ABAC|nr:bro [Peridroma alphabaculovirus]AIE47841.1 bro [Peridroma alphabaculovirus]
MAQVKIGLFKFGEEEFELRYVIRGDGDVRFVAKDIAKVLKYSNAKDAVKKHVDEKYKGTFENKPKNCDAGARVNESTGPQNAAPIGDARVVAKQGSPLYLQPHTILITKSGVIQLIMKSKLPYAVELQEWLLEEVIPQVLCTGKYQPAIENNANDPNTVTMLNQISQSLTNIRRDNEQLQTVIVKKDQQIEQTTRMISRVMNDMNRMYTGFQNTMQKKDEMFQQIIQKKDNQVDTLMHRVVDLSQRAVVYPVDEKKMPVLCVSQMNRSFHVITGQRSYVTAQKNKIGIPESTIIVEKRRPNPKLDWNNAVHAMARHSGVKRMHALILCDTDDTAEQFAKKLKDIVDDNINTTQ